MSLAHISDHDLIQELARRLLQGQAPLGSMRRGKQAAKEFATKAAWAESKKVAATIALTAAELAGDPAAVAEATPDVVKYERMASIFRRRGE